MHGRAETPNNLELCVLKPAALHRIRAAFASYASDDRDAVIGRLQGVQTALPDVDIFMDVVSLRSGETWKERIQEAILAADVFYLFWSESAIESKWVDFEWRFALEARGLNFISPVWPNAARSCFLCKAMRGAEAIPAGNPPCSPTGFGRTPWERSR